MFPATDSLDFVRQALLAKPLTPVCPTRVFQYCPECVETRLHPQPFRDAAGRLLCGACWFLDGQEVEMIQSDDIFPKDITGSGDND